MPEFESRDPKSPAFWDERFERGFTPWDKGGVPEQLLSFVVKSRPSVVLIPGCGAAYELVHFCEAGWDAVAIDFSPAAVDRAKQTVGKWQDRVVEADFFAYEPHAGLNVIYERAFLCALPRAMWPQVAQRWARLLPPGGVLAGYFFFDDVPKGPPFGIKREELDRLLSEDFVCVEDAAVPDSIPVFAGKERWMVWTRK
ncbi:methyltransferase [Massilia cavernae]|uniref:Methyltransferase domain-containing protein n=1 Tax=Massilia cavernae TaxID=2320864 RepID=A0A418X7R2_9BURK|nr:methyltransferase [Massilia cavernae]RJG08545.1 methyltransferase domain-containing protein [Massilia cavernae]